MKTFEGTYYSPLHGFRSRKVYAKNKAQAKKLLGTMAGYKLVEVYEA